LTHKEVQSCHDSIDQRIINGGEYRQPSARLLSSLDCSASPIRPFIRI
jgi:hypothetical protein